MSNEVERDFLEQNELNEDDIANGLADNISLIDVDFLKESDILLDETDGTDDFIPEDYDPDDDYFD